MKRWVILLGCVIAAFTACHPEPTPRAATPIPAEICDEAQAAVAELTEAGALFLNSPTEGVIAQEVWLRTPSAPRDGIIRAVGIAATCAKGTAKLQQEVTIRSETGMILTRRIVETSFSLPTDEDDTGVGF